MRRLIAVLCLMAALELRAAEAPDALLERGIESYRAAHYAAAVMDLDAAAKGFLSSSDMETYVNTGRLARLQPLETSLVYLALAHFRLGREESARETIARLIAAERIAPAYASLPLAQDAADFEAVAAALLPESNLPHNVALAAVVDDASKPLPPVRPAIAARSETTVQERQQVAEAVATPAPVVTPMPAPMSSQTPSKVPSRMPAQTSTAARPQQPVTTFASSPAPIPTNDSAATREALTLLRQAEDAASRGDLTQASETYIRITHAQNVAREVIAEAAVGLYRIGSYRESAAAFRRVGTFAKGEDDLRYYFAVALYESGEYQAAERELACALPFIEATEDVLRYRWKIENTAAVVAMK